MSAESPPSIPDLCTIRGLCVSYRDGEREVRALDGIDLDIRAGERCAIVGESGSGKSTLALALVRLLPPRPACVLRGSVRFEGRPVLEMPDEELRALRANRIGIVFQDHASALNPLMRIGDQVAEIWTAHESVDRANATGRAEAALARVGLDPARVGRAYPHELSGGMRQRVQIAMAVARRPAFLILDEPTTALDTVTQAEVFALIEELRAQSRFALLLVTHDLALARAQADRAVVMNRGRIVRDGPAALVLAAPPAGPDTARAPRPPRPDAAPLLAVRDLAVAYPRRAGFVRRMPGPRVVDGVAFEIARGERLAIVGNSGSGKTTLVRALLRLVGACGGTVAYRPETGSDVDLLALAPRALRRLRPDLGLVFQDPSASLNPRRRARAVLFEALAVRAGTNGALEARARECLHEVGLEPAHLDSFPHELSGGERQRLCIARALATRPRLLVLDEAVSSLDQESRARCLALLSRACDERGLACVLVTHDLGSVESFADRVAVLARGRIVETGATARVFAAPERPETRALLDARPSALNSQAR